MIGDASYEASVMMQRETFRRDTRNEKTPQENTVRTKSNRCVLISVRYLGYRQCSSKAGMAVGFGTAVRQWPHFLSFGRANMLSLLRLSIAFFLGLGVPAPPGVPNLWGLIIGFLALAPTSRGASRASPSGTWAFLRFLAARSAASFSASSSSVLTRCLFLLIMPCGRARKAGWLGGALFSLLGLVLILMEAGKLPGMLAVGMIDWRTWRTLDWPGDEPNPPGETSPKLIVWSLRKVNVPGPGPGPGRGALAGFCFSAGSGRGRYPDRSG